jgi:Fe2+ or Zn2+ uptake regulation protein
MNTLENKDLLLEAINSYEMYSNTQNALLKILVMLEINNVASVGIQYLMTQLKLSRAQVYNALRNLQNDDAITKIRLKNTKQDSYQLNQEKLDYIVQLYHNKKAIENME